uniref:Hesp-379 n=1 Tax=Melampsora lini TaxID=5261 RepID=Q2MV38_MELLI|nr:hesp-379 [Melampsora lini]
MRTSALLTGLVSLAASSLAFTVNGPSASSYWVQFSTNTISWTQGSGDPPVVSLQIINPSKNLLNGAFSIAEYVKASLESYTVTNVTLLVGDGYQVQMVNSTNATQVYASSGAFSVKDANTAAAPVATSSGSGSNGSGSATGTNGNSANGSSMTSNTTSTSSGTRTAGSGAGNSTAGSNAKSSATISNPAMGLLTVSLAAIGFASL